MQKPKKLQMPRYEILQLYLYYQAVSAKKQVNSQAIFHGIHAPLFLLIATCHTSKHVVGG